MVKRFWAMYGNCKKYAILTPVLVICEVVFDLIVPIFMSKIIDVGINGNGGVNFILRYGIYMVLLSILSLLFGGASGFAAAKASAGLGKNIRTNIFNKVQDFSFANIDKFSTASLITRLTSDVMQIRMAFMQGIRMLVRAPIMVILTTILAMDINADLAIVFFAAIPLLSFSLYFVFKKAHPLFLVMMKKYDVMNSAIQENLIGIRVVKTFVRGDYETKKFEAASRDVRDTQAKAEKILAFNTAAFELIMYACMIAVAWFGGKFIIAGSMTTGNFMRYMSYVGQILMALMMISMALVQFVMAEASVDRIIEVLDEDIDIKDMPTVDNTRVVEEGSLTFENVFFRYSRKSDKSTLENINLTINPGEIVGIIGGTGSGKTSLVQLIPRLYDVTEGSVKVGGKDVREYSRRRLRESIGVVLQKNVLFSGTIMENLRWGKENASDEEVYEACKAAQAHDFILSFPAGYDTFLGQGGVNLSGGQKQRICIARALLKKPKIMILDDSTSAIDTDTDSRIRKALRTELSGMTTLIIAQRIASVSDADKIIVMDDGKIQDVGTHTELIKRNEIYQDLYESQLKGVA